MFAFLILLLSSAFAGDSQNRIVYENIFGVRVNPLGLQEQVSFLYQRQFFGPDTENILWKDSYFAVGPTLAINPSGLNGGIEARLEPLVIFRIVSKLEGAYWFGNFGNLMVFPGSSEDYSDSQIKVLDDAGTNVPAGGLLSTTEVRFQAMVGPIAARNTTTAFYADLKWNGGSTHFYDQSLDLLRTAKGWALTNDVDLLYLINSKWTAGVRHSLGRSFLQDNSVADLATHKVGPLVAFEPYKKPGEKVDSVIIFLLSQWNVVHPYRTGADVSAAIPTVTIGVGFGGDLLPRDR